VASYVRKGCLKLLSRLPARRIGSGIQTAFGAMAGGDARTLRGAWLFIDLRSILILFDPTADRAISCVPNRSIWRARSSSVSSKRAILFEALGRFPGCGWSRFEASVAVQVLCRAADRRARRFFPTLEFFIKALRRAQCRDRQTSA